MEVKNETPVELNAGDVRIFNHDGAEFEKDVSEVIDYWKNTLAVYGMAQHADFDIHVWDRDGFCHVEAGIRVYHKRGFDGIVSRAIFVIDMLKDAKNGIIIVDPTSSPWHDDIQRFADDTVGFLEKEHGWKSFHVFDMNEFEFKFFQFEPMMLDEEGRRIAKSGEVIMDEGYKTFGLTTASMVDMLL